MKRTLLLLLFVPLLIVGCKQKKESLPPLDYSQLQVMRTEIQNLIDNADIGDGEGQYPQDNYNDLVKALDNLDFGISKANAGIFILQFEINNYVKAAQKAINSFNDSKIIPVPVGDPAELFVNGVDHKGYIDFGASQDYCGGSTFTVEAWTKYNEGFTEFVFGSFLSVFTSPAPYAGWTLHYWGVDNPLIRFSIGNESLLPTIAAAAPQTYGKWIHFAATYNASAKTMCLYINGELKASDTNYSGGIITSGDKRMWAFVEPKDNSRCMSGFIKKFRMWSTAKTQSEIQSLMNSDVTGTESDLTCAWDFTTKVADPDAIPDKTGNHTAKLVGTYRWKPIL